MRIGRIQSRLRLLLLGIWLAALALVPSGADLISASNNAVPSSALTTVTGTWEFRNRGDTAFLPARHFLAEVCNATGTLCDGNSIAHTDMQGNFTLQTDQFGGQNVTVNLMTWASYPNGTEINVVIVEGAGQGAPGGAWGILSPPFSPGQNLVHQVPFTAIELPAFWIMDDFTEGMLQIPLNDQGDVSVEAYWGPQFDSILFFPITVTRSFFCYGILATFSICDGGRIYLFADDIRVGDFGPGLPDRLPLHEMGHPVQYYMYGLNLPAPTTDYWFFSFSSWSFGPCGSWAPENALPGNGDCAWQEGWADW